MLRGIAGGLIVGRPGAPGICYMIAGETVPPVVVIPAQAGIHSR